MKGLLVLAAILGLLMGLLVAAKMRPAPGTALLQNIHPAVTVV